MSDTPDVNDVRERVARIVYAFGYANGAFMWPWESASSEAQQDARSHADTILDAARGAQIDGSGASDE